MVHRLTESRLFMVTLAALMLLAFMPWHGIGTCCCCGTNGDQTPEVAPSGSCCCESGTGTEAPVPPKAPGPCPCKKMAEKAVGLADFTGPEAAPAMVLLCGAVEPVAVAGSATAAVHVLLPKASTGPPLHLRLQVLLI